MLVALAAHAADIDASGRVEAHVRLATSGCTAALAGDCGWVDFHDAAVLGGEVRADFDRRVRAAAAADLRLHAGTALDDLDDSGDPAALQPYSLRVREAAVALGGEHAELTLGADTLAWGVADGVNPVNLLNPYDLEDPTRLDRRLAVPMVAGRLFGQRAAIEVAWAPFFVPAALPTAQVDLLAGARDLFEIEGGAADLREVESRVDLPDATLVNGGVAARASAALGPVDLAISWFHGRDSLPQVGGEILLTGFATDDDRVDVGIPVVYPRLDVGGIEARGELPWEVGAWAEVAVVLPERVEATMSAAQLHQLEALGAIDEVPDPVPVTVTQDGLPYVRWVAGAERSFDRVYLNVQWLHGFPTERRADEVGDYAMLVTRITLSDRWVVTARVVSDLAGAMAGGDVAYLHGDAAELTLGGMYVAGPEGSALGGFRGVSHVGTGVVVRF